ncbi:ATP-dependent nuclease [Francisella philomiragia]|uniref:ATP-dependent nuclease n=1 Tax=Francisella philomiragia TaxID=28110 RepID=UPI001C9E1271|nr:AAA family ATPase [Francisella philomiragia]MBY7734923.1 AAA family ATPase [Francisella philomiragia]
MNSKYKLTGKKNNTKLIDKDRNKFLEQIYFFYLGSINISFPETIKYIMNQDIIELETSNSRFRGKKKKLKENIESALSLLQELLDDLGQNVTPFLEEYKHGWGVAFDLPKEVNTFRDLIIAETDFYIRDISKSKSIDSKGSGLQRLTHVLMHFRILQKLKEKNKTVIFAIDEPDVYLHSGLQKKLFKDIKKYSINDQFFITTHSPHFIDTSDFSKIFLLEQHVEEGKKFKRSGNKEYNIISTNIVSLTDETGVSKIKRYLGIDDTDNILLDKYNILVEGEEDKKYLTVLLKKFGFEIPNIISSNGADNIPKQLEFYNSVANKEDQVKFCVICDNDEKGRSIYRGIKDETYKNLFIEKELITSHSGYSPSLDQNGNANCNIEIEDFINPKILCELINKLLKKKNFKCFSMKDINSICIHIKQAAFRDKGILALLDHKKNELNPSIGNKFIINGQGAKSGLASLFEKEFSVDISNKLGTRESEENEHIIAFLEKISTPSV